MNQDITGKKAVVMGTVGGDGGGLVGTYDKFGYVKEGLGKK